jgi:hypothetical protein
VARSLVKDAVRGIKSGEGPYFRIMNGPRESERIELSDAQEIIVGRDETADIVFKDDLVSRRHVKFRRDWAGTHVEDLGSRNGIKINKKKVNRKTLKDGDEVEVGNTRLLYVDPSDMPEPSVVMPEDPVDSGGADDEEENTQNLPAPKLTSRRARAAPKEEPKPEPPPEEPAKEEPPPPEPEPAAEPPVEDPPMPPPEPMRPYVPEEPVQSGGGRLGGFDKQKMVPLVLMGVFALFAIGLIIAVLAGA